MVLSRSLRNLTLRGLPLTGLLLAFSSISAFALIAAFAAMYSVSKVDGPGADHYGADGAATRSP
jgi:hypothetical protein